MSKKKFSKNPEVIELVRLCHRQKDSDAIAFIRRRGYDISDRTYRRIKKELRDLDQTIPYDFTGKFLDFTVNSISEYEEVQRCLVGIITSEKSSTIEKMRAIDTSIKNRSSIIPIFDSAHVVEGLRVTIRGLQRQIKEKPADVQKGPTDVSSINSAQTDTPIQSSTIPGQDTAKPVVEMTTSQPENVEPDKITSQKGTVSENAKPEEGISET
jgi:hypothetical protein